MVFTTAQVTELIFAVTNIAVVVYWRWKFKSIQGNDMLIRTLKDQVEAKDVVIDNLERAKSQYKLQYDNQFMKSQKLQTELDTYHKFHEHSPLIKVEKLVTEKLALK